MSVAEPAGRYLRLRRVVERLTPDQLRRFAATLDRDDLALLEEVLGDMGGEHWRADPARMAHYLTDGEYQLWPYVTLLSEAFRDAIRGVAPRQQWQLPSQYGKTSAAKWGIVWALDQNPKLRILYVTYDADKAVEEMGEVRDWVEEHQGVLRFRIRPDRRARRRWVTDEGGGLYATGIRGGITGRPGDAVVLDDLIKGWQAAHSEAERDFTWNVYRSQIRLRIQGLRCPIIDIGTRWHEDDHHKRMVINPVPGEDWRIIRLPAIAEAPNPQASDPLLREPDALGRIEGQVLEERRFPPEEVNARRLVLGPYLWAAMEQQRPAPEEGTDIMRAWFQIEELVPAAPDEAIASWDMKLKDVEAGDYVVGGLWWRVGGGYWLMDVLRGQWNEATTKVAFALMVVRHREVGMQYYENTGNAPELVAELRRGEGDSYEIPDDVADKLGLVALERDEVTALLRRGMSNLVPVNPGGQGSKRVRARAVTPIIAGQNVHLPASAPWLPAYLDEMAAFPNGTHDDQVDMTSQALSKLAGGLASLPEPSGDQRVPVREPAVPGGIATRGGSSVPGGSSVHLPRRGGR